MRGPLTVSKKNRVAWAADDLVGTPFRNQGRSPGIGLDCAGVVCSAYGAVGVQLAHDNEYAWHSNYSELMNRILSDYFDVIEEPESCAAVTLWVKTPGIARHLGLLVPGPSGFDMIHASQGTTTVVRERFGARWRKKVVSYWRLKEWQPSH
jgi:cell wall-associated NlpC family hydrolase